MITNCYHGKNNSAGTCMIKVYCKTKVSATIIPTITPIEQLANTSTIASQKQSILILILVTPIALRTAISLVCQKRLADILALKAKKHKNMVITIITLKTLFRILLIFSVEFDDAPRVRMLQFYKTLLKSVLKFVTTESGVEGFQLMSICEISASSIGQFKSAAKTGIEIN